MNGELFPVPLRTSLARLDEALSDLYDVVQMAHGRHYEIIVNETAVYGDMMMDEILGVFASRQEAVDCLRNNQHWNIGYQGMYSRKYICLCAGDAIIAKCDKDGFPVKPITDEDIPF